MFRELFSIQSINDKVNVFALICKRYTENYLCAAWRFHNSFALTNRVIG